MHHWNKLTLIACISIFVFVCPVRSLFAVDYFVSNSGSDANPGTNSMKPFLTLKKAQSLLGPGDRLYLERGSIFFETFSIEDNNVVLSNYGKGDLPIISNELTLEGIWKRKPLNNVWELELENKLPRVFGLYRNGKRLTLGRYPEKTHSPYSGYFGRYDRLVRNYLKDTTGLYWTENFTGAEVAVRPNRWYLEIYKIVDQNDTALILDADIKERIFARDLGYFFIHHPMFCNEEGEWGYDTQTGNLFLNSASDPNKSKFTTLGHVNAIEIKNAKHVSIDGIRFEENGLKSIAAHGVEDLSVMNCEFVNGGRAVFIDHSNNTLVSNCIIRDMYMPGIVYLHSDRGKFINNDFENIGTQGPVHGNGDGMWHFSAINTGTGGNTLVEGNHIVHCGYNGILVYGKNTRVRKNYIDAFNTLIDDGGAIHSHGGKAGNLTGGMVIEQNIIVNSLGNPAGGPTLWGKPHTASSGIYLDDRQRKIIVRDNIVAHITHYGLFLKGNTEPPYRSDIVVENNLFFNCEQEMFIDGQFRKLKHYFKGAQVINNQLWDIDGPVPVASEVPLNFVWQNGHKEPLAFNSTEESDLRDIEFSKNRVITPRTLPIRYQGQKMTVESFNKKLKASFEVLKITPGQARNTILVYNKENETKTFPLVPGTIYTDIDQNIYRYEIELKPFTGIVLMPK